MVPKMSAKQNFKHVRIAVLERDSDVRQAIKSSLVEETFTRTFATQALKKFQTAVFNDEADLMIADVDAGEDRKEIITLMKQIRHNEICQNPFPVSIALTGNSDFQNIKQIVDSGFDTLLLKPFSMSSLIQRVQGLRQQRAPFAVTSEYIGPDRRKNHRPNSPADQDCLINVPNPLKIMATGKLSASNMQGLIKESLVLVNDLRIQSQGERISQLIVGLTSKFVLGEMNQEFIKGLKLLDAVSMDMDHRLARSKFAHVADLCATLRTVVLRILERPMEPSGKDMELLQNLGNAIERAFQAKEGEIATARSISESIRAVA